MKRFTESTEMRIEFIKIQLGKKDIVLKIGWK